MAAEMPPFPFNDPVLVVSGIIFAVLTYQRIEDAIKAWRKKRDR
jgi:hypothetical protein